MWLPRDAISWERYGMSCARGKLLSALLHVPSRVIKPAKGHAVNILFSYRETLSCTHEIASRCNEMLSCGNKISK